MTWWQWLLVIGGALLCIFGPRIKAYFSYDNEG